MTVVALVAGGLAAVATVVAFANPDTSGDVVLEADTATLASPPAAPNAAQAEPTTSSTAPPPTAPALTAEKVPPSALTIPDLSISQPVLAVGLQDDGAMEVPDVEDIGWYRNGAVPGRPGATVLVAHVWWGSSPGPFAELGKLEPGALIDVQAGDTAHSYVVVERTMYDKESLPSSLWRNTGPETLALITCGGSFDESSNRYEQNIVVLAKPVAAEEPLGSS